MFMRSIVLIAHDIRSCHNVGSLLRTADGFGVDTVYLTGYTPYPSLGDNDSRLPHISKKQDRQIAKTALGAEKSQTWRQAESLDEILSQLKQQGFKLAALEQASNAVSLVSYRAPDKIALLLGREVEGINARYLKQMDKILELPMLGKKESLNVVIAAAVALFQLRHGS